METWKRRMGKGEADRAAGRALRPQRKSPERPDAAPEDDAELIEITQEACEEIGPDGGYGGAGLDKVPAKH
jgi:hypothetical protein